MINQVIRIYLKMVNLFNFKLFAMVAGLLSFCNLVLALNFPPSKLPISAITSASREACAGMRARYFCDIDDPATFHICLGRKRFTMICPGLLHFSERTQTCDWPDVAKCRRLPSFPPSERPPVLGQYNSSVLDFYPDVSDTVFDSQELTKTNSDPPLLSHIAILEEDTDVSGTKKPQRPAKRRYKMRKPGKYLVRNYPVSRWWNNPPATSGLSRTSESFQTDPDTILQPYSDKIFASNDSIIRKTFEAKDSADLKTKLEENIQKTAGKHDFAPRSRYYNKKVKVPWYRPLDTKVNNQTTYSPLLSSKKRNSRESRVKPHKTVIISPFKPFITERQVAPRRSINKKLKVNLSETKDNKKPSSSAYEAPLIHSRKIYPSFYNQGDDSLKSKYLETEMLISKDKRQSVEKNPTRQKSYRNPRSHKSMKPRKEKRFSNNFDTNNRDLELTGLHEAESTPLLIKDYGNVRSLSNTEILSSPRFEENGVQRPRNLPSRHSFRNQYKGSHFEHRSYKNSAAKLKMANVQRDKKKAKILSSAKDQNVHLPKEPEMTMTNDWTSVLGVAGIPDYNPDQAMRFPLLDTGNLDNSVSFPIKPNNNRAEASKLDQNYGFNGNKLKKGSENQNGKDLSAVNKDSNFEFRNTRNVIQREEDLQSKRNEISNTRDKKQLKGRLGVNSGPYKSDISIDRPWFAPKLSPKETRHYSGEDQNFRNHIVPGFSSAAASKPKIPVRNTDYDARQTKVQKVETTKPPENPDESYSAIDDESDEYKRQSKKRAWQQSNLSKHVPYTAVEMTPISGTFFTNLGDNRFSTHKTSNLFRKEAESPSNSGFRQTHNLLDRKKMAKKDFDDDSPRSATFHNSHSPDFLNFQETPRRPTGDSLKAESTVHNGAPQKGLEPHFNFFDPKTPTDYQNLAMLEDHQEKSHFTSVTSLQPGNDQSSKHFSQRKIMSREKMPTLRTATSGFSSDRNKQHDHRKHMPKLPPNSNTRTPTPGLSPSSRSQEPLHHKEIPNPSEQESYPNTLNFALHGLGYPQNSQRRYSLHRPNHRTSNVGRFVTKTKDVSHYSLYGLGNRPETSVRNKDKGPVLYNDSRFKLKKEARVRLDKETSEDLKPRTSPIEKYKTRRERCSKKWCQLPSCRCVGTDIPGGLPRGDTPQMVLLTFDDSINIQNINYYRRLLNGTFKNPNGCPFKGTFYVSGDNTDYRLVKEVYKSGHEIASHTISHRSPTTWWAYAGYDNWNSEVVGMRERLHKNAGITIEEIAGMRAPFLQVGGDAQYAMLAENNFRYDTSMVTGDLHSSRKSPIWPFTLDTAPNGQTCSLTPCPRRSYPGLWEVPLVRWYGSNNMACAMPDACTIGSGAKGSLKFLEENFKRHYQRNKAPFGIFIHASWFSRQRGTLEGLAQFLDLVSHMEDVWVVSVSQALDWVQHPVPIGQLDTIKSWTC